MNTLSRAAACCAASLWLAGCSSLGTTSYETIRIAVLGPQAQITTEHVNQLTVPALVARLGQSEALLLLASRQQAVAEWHGVDQHLVTCNGKLMHSAGLPAEADVLVALAENDPFLGDLRNLVDGLIVTRLVDYPARYLTGVPQHATYSLGPSETLEIMGQQVELQRVDEAVSMPALGFKADNRYWYDPADGRVIASAQHVAPGLPELFLTEAIPAGAQP
ncbi:Group 4 capsule polysaccharide lipoprotein gfcB, YjbF [Halopseudomonas xinjiangensis]|uniref:Group 4 capsule polysaccharide lipoprotein gfcB, YjbF n=1 Tax=Halopseudomonas xinjiangensis TaxID=487184 RepID=A0A1H1NJR9_9GAMM|nr:YjbF family lipoprotein [Halopseudomonas xinjiangensis]SDR99242.1 Group 4 capsule polysaccharide lipoprotein gfcB, YjbF [Halopseudomonas xinjiangensis]